MPKPVIFLAFANDRVDHAAYLRNLPHELNDIRHALQPAVQEGLCEVVERANASIEQVLDVFQDAYYRDRIAIFHYGGHANSYELLLESAQGGHQQAHGEGLVSFLARQHGLQLVFLNGCSSQPQAQALIAAGLPAVVGTSQSISDDVALRLAARFYRGLGQGAAIDKAWREAVDEVKMAKGTANLRELLWEGAPEEAAALGHFPWEFSVRPGAGRVRDWNLADASGNPLFGLPEPPHGDLPEQPFRFLDRYTRADAPVFFGRAAYIRSLFERMSDPKGPPLLLFYGQSGVGKSSLLEAGLFPRLEQVCEVRYVRRDAAKGLLGTMQAALGVGEGPSKHSPSSAAADLNEKAKRLEELAQSATGDLKTKLLEALALMRERAQRAGMMMPAQENTLREAWLRIEATTGRPLVVLLDQVEEMYTKPNPRFREEVQESLAEVYDLFAHAQQRPQGKLILSYRKEYHPEIDEAFKAMRLPREEVFLRKLERDGIEEVVRGLGSRELLRRQYRLSIEEHLPTVIADDLLADEGSPIAPVLQIVLTKMWLQVEQEEHRLLSIGDYQHLKKKGILMGDFFQEQMEKLRAWNQGVERSGLALDVLYSHTTSMGTAGILAWDSLQRRYAHQKDVLAQLIEQFKSLYLLTDVPGGTGLAHDTLAPIVQQEFRRSDLPGHRASRILESKREEFEHNRQSLLDATDLQLVEQGQAGMPAWSRLEQELVEASREKREQEQAFRRWVRRAAMVAAALIASLAVVATYQWRQAEAQTRLAEERAAEASLRRLGVELALEDRKKEPRTPAVLRAVYAAYPEHPLTAQLFYARTFRLPNADRHAFETHQEAFAHDNRRALSGLSPEDAQEVALYSAQPGVEATARFPSTVALAAEGGETYQVAVVTRDYNPLWSCSIHPSLPLLAVATADGLVKLHRFDGELVWQGGQYREETEEGGEAPYPTAVVFDEAANRLLVRYSDDWVYRLEMDVSRLAERLPEGERGALSEGERRYYGLP